MIQTLKELLQCFYLCPVRLPSEIGLVKMLEGTAVVIPCPGCLVMHDNLDATIRSKLTAVAFLSVVMPDIIGVLLVEDFRSNDLGELPLPEDDRVLHRNA